MDNKDKRFATLRFEKSPMREILLKALDIVRHFIIKNDLILVGGMSIDGSMRLKGLKLYGDDEIPDYDMYSPMNAEHAYRLGNMLCEEKFPNVDVISAIHVTTMKVRVDGNVVADITYMPPTIFKTIKTQTFKGIKIIHPWYNMMDQFRSLSNPYENPPNEVILNRGKKDVDRLNLLLSVYPLGDDSKKIKLPELQTITLEKKDGNFVYNGWAALAFYYHYYKISDELDYDDTSNKFKIPVKYLTIMTDNWVPKEGEDYKYYNGLGGFPHHIKTKSMEIFVTSGERITVFHKNPKFVSFASLMYYFFHTWLMRNDELSLLGIQMTSKILEHVQILDVTPFGQNAWNMSTLYSIANILNWERVKSWKPAAQDFSKECKMTRSFDPANSPLFQIDESETKKIEPLIDLEILKLKTTKLQVPKIRSFQHRSIVT